MRPEDDRTTRLFAALRGRPTPDRDGDAAWNRLRAELTPREAPVSAWLGWRPALAGAAAMALLATVALWGGLSGPELAPGADVAPGSAVAPPESGSREVEPSADSGFVLLSEPIEEEAPAPARYTIEVRLLRAVAAADLPPAGAGGADPLGDLRAVLDSVAPDRAYVIDGTWERELAPGAMAGELTGTHGIRFEVDAGGPASLRSVQLTGEALRLVADRLDLRPGEPYVFGVLEASGETGETLLAIRLRPVAEDAGGGDAPSESPRR